MVSKDEVLDILQKWERIFGSKSERDKWIIKTWGEKDRDIEEFRREFNKVIIYILNKPEKPTAYWEDGKVILVFEDGRKVDL